MKVFLFHEMKTYVLNRPFQNNLDPRLKRTIQNDAFDVLRGAGYTGLDVFHMHVICSLEDIFQSWEKHRKSFCVTILCTRHMASTKGCLPTYNIFNIGLDSPLHT